jgi:hypothetical protein
MDRNFTNELQDSNILVSIYINNEFVTNVTPASFVKAREYWDIGFINPRTADFIEVNSFMQ